MNDKLKRTSYYLGIGLGIILLVAFLTSQIIMPLFFGRAKTVKVPDVSGMTIGEAKKLLTDKKLHAVVNDSTWSEDIPANQVISQKPEFDTMAKPDGTVFLVISRGSHSVIVPEVIGMNVQAAWIILNKTGLRIAIADSIYSDLYPLNTVVQSQPGMGSKVDRKTRVKLFLSKGSNPSADSLRKINEYQ